MGKSQTIQNKAKQKCKAGVSSLWLLFLRDAKAFLSLLIYFY
jgi:hypothetical protein